jgi:hypothetical protein
MMIISPFISVSTTILLTSAYLKIFSNDGDSTQDLLKKIVSVMLPIFMLTGFCSTSGIYMITPIQEREVGLR